MPKEPRKKSRAKTVAPQKQVVPRSGGPFERLRFRCPCCGMMPEVERLENTKPELRLYVQRMGGRKPAPPGVRPRQKNAPGLMEYEDITEERPDLYDDLQRSVHSRLKKAMKELF